MLPLGCFRSLGCSKTVFPQGNSETIILANIQEDNKLKLTILLKHLSYSLAQVFEAFGKKKKQNDIFVNAVFLKSSFPYKSVLAF